MRKFLTRVSLLAAGMLMLGTSGKAQMPQMPLAPVDSAVIIGKLPNGLTYYIRHNDTSKGMADFYIAQKVGSALEEDNQRGLAHFLEHMCFNGTENFPGNSLIDWLETIGVKFGQNLNAYTSIDETVYNIASVPVARKGVQDSVLLILHDWADGLLLDPEEIDKERGVIHQEWRRTNVGQMRILESLLPIIYPGNKYGERLPIGTMEVVDNFPPQALRDYYETWYRPDQQGIVVVGDIDPAYIEAKIKEIFSPIQMPANPKERVYIQVEDTPGTIYAIGKDKEQTVAMISLMFKSDPLIPTEMNNTVAYFPVNYMTRMVGDMFGNRLDEIASKPESPIANAGGSFDDFLLAKTKKAFDLTVLPKGNDILPAFEAAYRELRRATEGGFTPGEYERAKSEYLSRIESVYENRNNRQNGTYVNEYIRNFIDNTPIPSIEDSYEMAKMISAQIPLEAINSFLPEIIKADNRVLLALFPDNPDFPVPTEEEFAAIIAKVDAETLEPYRDEVKDEPLIPALPAPGKIVSETHDAQWDATTFTLSNGVKVIVKPTKFKDNEILFNAVAVGGYSELPDERAADIITMPNLIKIGKVGLGSYNSLDITKYLQGKQAAVRASYDEYYRTVSGFSTVKDLPTLMEFIYATFTEFTISPDDYTAGISTIKSSIKNQNASPSFKSMDNILNTIYASPKLKMISEEILDNATREGIIEIATSSLANAADFTFVFVGNIDMDTFRPLLEQYIATLPADAATARTSMMPDPSLELKGGVAEDTFSINMETPQTYVFIAASGSMPYTTQNALLANIAGQILSKRLLNTVREDMGAVYSIGAAGNLSRMSKINAIIQTYFPMKPEMKKEVLDFIQNEFKAMTGNITEEELAKIKEFMVKEAKENLELNSPWLDAISDTTLNGVDTFNGEIDAINAITVDDVQNFMKALLDQNNYRIVITDPAE